MHRMCARNRQFSTPERCHNQTDPLAAPSATAVKAHELKLSLKKRRLDTEEPTRLERNLDDKPDVYD